MNSPAPASIVHIPSDLWVYIPQALVRLGYLYKDLEFRQVGEGVAVEGKKESLSPELRREVRYQVYREKIYQESLPLRSAMYKMLSGR